MLRSVPAAKANKAENLFKGVSTLRGAEKKKEEAPVANKALQDYLAKQYGGGAAGGGAEPKRKKKKEKPSGAIRIVDQDVTGFAQPGPRERGTTKGSAKAAPGAGVEDDESEEEAPLIANPEEAAALMRLAEKVKSGSGWVAADEAARRSAPAGPRRARDSPDASPPRRRQRHDSPDASPPRRGQAADASPPRQRQRHDSPDASPPRRGQAADASPPRRRQRHDSPDASPPRKGRVADASPPRRGQAPDASPPRRGQRHDSPDAAPPRRGRAPDASPSRRGQAPDASPPRRGQRHDSPDASPPRRGRAPDASPSRRGQAPDASPPRRGQRHDSPDASPPRRGQAPGASPPRRRQRHDSPDASPPRRGRVADASPPRRRQAADASPPQRGQAPDASPPRRRQRHDSPDASPRGAADRALPQQGARGGGGAGPLPGPRMNDGTAVGLVNAAQLAAEMQRHREQADARRRNAEGAGAQTVYRDKATGRVMTAEEAAKAKEDERAARKKPSIYDEDQTLEWRGGLAQKREAEARRQAMAEEASKPFARADVDDSHDASLRERVRFGDPFAHLARRKQPSRAEGAAALTEQYDQDKLLKSGFKIPQEVPPHSWLKRGVAAPANRYNIRPGRHWDGVNRSNGFEAEMFKHQNLRAAKELEARLWGMGDM